MTRGGQVRVNWSRGETGPAASSLLFSLFWFCWGEEDIRIWVEQDENEWPIRRGRCIICPSITVSEVGRSREKSNNRKFGV